MLKKIVLSILGKGKSELELRRLILEKTRNIVNTDTSMELPLNELDLYIEKLSRNSYKIQNEDIETLKSNGFSEDEIYELTIVAAFGAGEARVNRAINLLTTEYPKQ